MNSIAAMSQGEFKALMLAADIMGLTLDSTLAREIPILLISYLYEIPSLAKASRPSIESEGFATSLFEIRKSCS